MNILDCKKINSKFSWISRIDIKENVIMNNELSNIAINFHKLYWFYINHQWIHMIFNELQKVLMYFNEIYKTISNWTLFMDFMKFNEFI